VTVPTRKRLKRLQRKNAARYASTENVSHGGGVKSVDAWTVTCLQNTEANMIMTCASLKTDHAIIPPLICVQQTPLAWNPVRSPGDIFASATWRTVLTSEVKLANRHERLIRTREGMLMCSKLRLVESCTIAAVNTKHA